MFKNSKVRYAISLGLGLVFLSTAVFADIANKTGYELFKDSIKHTSSVISKDMKNYTLQLSLSIKFDDKVIYLEEGTQKYDYNNNMTESIGQTITGTENPIKHYSFTDIRSNIYTSDNENFILNEYKNDLKLPTPPSVEKEITPEVEKFIDAVVASVKNNVMSEEKPDGTKEFYGTLTDGQIPAVMNAGASLIFKQGFANDFNDKFPEVKLLEKDLTIKNITGKASTNKEGIITNLYTSGELHGKDSNNNVHLVTVEVLAKITDINSTKITKPDITNKKVVKNTDIDRKGTIDYAKYPGKYKSDIVVTENGKFKKIGERIVNIAHADNKSIAGKYSEIYYEGYNNNIKIEDFTFDAEFKGDNSSNADFSLPNLSKDERGTISLGYNSAKIYLHLPNSFTKGTNIDSEFMRVFEN